MLQGFGNHQCIHPRKLTWHPKIDTWKRSFLLETIILRFHVSFRECMLYAAFPCLSTSRYRDDTNTTPGRRLFRSNLWFCPCSRELNVRAFPLRTWKSLCFPGPIYPRCCRLHVKEHVIQRHCGILLWPNEKHPNISLPEAAHRHIAYPFH